MNRPSYIPSRFVDSLLCLFSAAMLFAPSAKATALVEDSLSLGILSGAGANTVAAGSHGAAFGISNVVSHALGMGGGNLAIGYRNTVDSGALAVGDTNDVKGYGCAAIGLWNILQDSCQGVLAVGGWNNMSTGDLSMAIGVNNTSSGSEGLLLVGNFNGAEDTLYCLVSGTNNVADTAADSAAIGHGLILNNSSSSRVIVGQYNSGDETDALFVVGNGNGAAYDPHERTNAFVVHADGKVIIPKAQGDILMGEFGN